MVAKRSLLLLLNVLLILCFVHLFWKRKAPLLAESSKFEPNYMIRKNSFTSTSAQFSGTYAIYTFENLLNAEEAKLLEIAAISTLHRSGTISKNPISDRRTSYNTFLKTDVFQGTEIYNILCRIEHVAATLSGKPLVNQEPLQVARYLGGEYYKEHYDACVPENSEMCIEDARHHGMRYATLLIYMNDVDPEHGGETYFPLINAKFRPKVGTGVFFFNLLPNNENQHHPLSQHAALPLKGGTKWICNKWIRCKPYKQHQ